jgi:hypothetical protein
MIASPSSISSVRAPLTAPSNISCRAGDGVWWTTSSLGMLAELSVRAGPLNHGADVAVLVDE